MNKQILVLSSRKNFNCLGAECPRDCCHGWDKIHIDQQTIEKWKSVKDENTKSLLANYFSEPDDGPPILKMSDDNICNAFENGLCKIQKQLGHDYLSEICRNFPRVNFYNDYRDYESAVFSCPAIVDSVLFTDRDENLFFASEVNTISHQPQNENSKLLFMLDDFLGSIFDRTEYQLGVTLFFISDAFSTIINMVQSNQFTPQVMGDFRNNINNYLSDITRAVNNKKLATNAVTSGSFWKSLYNLLETHNVKKSYLADDADPLKKEISQCDGSFASFSKIYSHIRKYKKNANKQIKQQYTPLLRNYARLTFINKGFPLAPNHSHKMVLVESFITICALQLLLWIEVNRNGKLTDHYIKDCIVEVDRKFALHNGVILALEEDSHMLHIEKYCNTFLDLF